MPSFGVKYFSDEALANFKFYKYSAEDHSILVKLFLKAFWDWVVGFCPSWVAPNLITASGFSLILCNFACLVYYSPTLSESCPPWVYLSWAIGIFVYQVLDNIDGKQARRTGSATPLGEIFDHGCDSLFATLSVITLCAAFQFPAWISHIFMLSIMFPFYFAHWEEFHTGKLILSAYGNPTESQLGMCLVHMITFSQGTIWWHQSWVDVARRWAFFLPASWFDLLAPVEVPVNMFVFYGFGMISVFAVLDNTRVVLKNVRQFKKSIFQSIILLIPIAINIGTNTYWFYVSPNSILENHTILCIVFTGLLSSYTLDRMLVNRITKTPFTLDKFVFLLPIFGLATTMYNSMWEETVLYSAFAVLLVCYAHMIYGIINELCDYLNIYCFKITPKLNKTS